MALALRFLQDALPTSCAKFFPQLSPELSRLGWAHQSPCREGTQGTEFTEAATAGVPTPRAAGPALVHGLSGTGLCSRRRVVGRRAKLHLHPQPLPSASITASALPHISRR